MQFPTGAHAWVAGQVASRGHLRVNHTLMLLSLPLSENKKYIYLLISEKYSFVVPLIYAFIG